MKQQLLLCCWAAFKCNVLCWTSYIGIRFENNQSVMGGTSCLPEVTQDRVFELAQTRASKIGIKWLELLVWGTFLERSIDYMPREGICISLVCPGLQLQRVIQFYHHALTVVFKMMFNQVFFPKAEFLSEKPIIFYGIILLVLS